MIFVVELFNNETMFTICIHRSLTSTSARSHVGAAGRVVPKNQKQVTISPALTYRELRRRCKEAGLLQKGRKGDLLARLGWQG